MSALAAYVQSVTYRPILARDGSVTGVERLTRWYGGRTALDRISADDYQFVTDVAALADCCEGLDALREGK
jgi:EAL domain-containing protein (putative c-di-GMP-specific phosphodiesterase class I)